MMKTQKVDENDLDPPAWDEMATKLRESIADQWNSRDLARFRGTDIR